MTFAAGYHARIWFDGLPSHGYLADIDADGNVQALDVTTLVKRAKSFIPGLEDAKIKMKGFFDSDSVAPATTFDYWMMSRKRQVYPISYFPEGGEEAGDPAYCLYGLMTSYTIDTSVKAAASLKLEFTTSRGLRGGKVVLADHTTSTANSGSPAVDYASGTTDGGWAAIQLSAISGTATPTLNAKLQHSTDGSTGWADIPDGGFTARTTVGGEFIEFTGTVNRYLRVLTTVSGTSPSFTFNVIAGRY